MNPTQILVPPECKVTIDGTEYTVHRFTVGDWLRIAKDLSDLATTVAKKIEEQKIDVKRIDKTMIFNLLIDEFYRVVPIMALAIQAEPKKISESSDLVGVSELFKTICEINDFRRIFANFTGAMASLQIQWKNAADSSEQSNS